LFKIKHSPVIVFLFGFFFFGAQHMDISVSHAQHLPPPLVIPFKAQVDQAFAVDLPRTVAVELFENPFENRFALLSLSDKNKISLSKFPFDQYNGRGRAAIGQISATTLALRLISDITILDFEKRKVVFTHRTALPRKDIVPEYFNAKIADAGKMLVIAELTPSKGSDGQLDPYLHSLVLDNGKDGKTLKTIMLGHAFEDDSPVFFFSDIILYRIKRSDKNEPWKALDNTLTPVSHPLCAFLDRHCASLVVRNMAVSPKFQHGLLFCFDAAKNTMSLLYLSWKSNSFSPVPLQLTNLFAAPRFMISPSEKWGFMTLETDSDTTKELYHVLVYLDPALPTGFLQPFVLNKGEVEDRVAWMTGPEGLVIFSEGHLSWWDLSKFDPKKPDANKQ
jgi:hypothetical protein